MLRAGLILGLCSVLCQLHLVGQSADEIVARMRTALGGAAKLNKVHSFQVTGTLHLAAADLDLPVILWWKAPGKLRVETVLLGKKTVHVYDGQHVWWSMPGMDGDDIHEAAAAEAWRMIEQARFWSTLLLPVDPGRESWSLDGLVTIDKRTCQRLKLTRPDRSVAVLLVKSDSWLPDRLSYVYKAGENQLDATLACGDFHAFGGILLPGRLDEAVSGLTETSLFIREYGLNAVIDDSVFTIPVKPAMVQK
jgi:hypothetical protein